MEDENSFLVRTSCNRRFIPIFVALVALSVIFIAYSPEPDQEMLFYVNTSMCHMVALPSIPQEEEDPVICGFKSQTEHLVQSDASFIWVDEKVLPHYGFERDDEVVCCYEEFILVDSSKDASIKNYGYQFRGSCKSFWNKEKVLLEFIRVNCKHRGFLFYQDYHSFVPLRKNSSEKRRSTADNRLNVLILGIDSVSRQNLRRSMTKTHTYLLKNLGAIEMMGFSTVGDDTFANLIPAWTGKTISELKNDCVLQPGSYLDFCKFIWDDYKLQGYYSAYSDDDGISGTFGPNMNSFQKNTTDYSCTRFNYASQKDNGQTLYGYGYGRPVCVGARLVYNTLLDYTEKFVQSLKEYLYFGIFWESSFTYDGIGRAALIDNHYHAHLEELKRLDVFNNTVLIFMSDHGFRFTSFLHHYRGILENRQPFLFFVFPKLFHDLYSEAILNLKINSRRLSTPFDLHETLKDLLNYTETVSTKQLKHRAAKLNKTHLPRGISLFTQIPEDRTCADAGIDHHWCTCYDKTPVIWNSHRYNNAAEFILNEINNIIIPYPNCHVLRLTNIISAFAVKPVGKNISNNLFYFTMTIQTKPGVGIFQATVEDHGNTFKLGGPISRLSSYGGDTTCVDSSEINEFCYCKSFLS